MLKYAIIRKRIRKPESENFSCINYNYQTQKKFTNFQDFPIYGYYMRPTFLTQI